ncbi:MAG: Holliday junction branch migration protein RuvA [Gemmatimonadota bacterium]|jgi:Holliday junction DNA helicase RuvA|nr:Holliday junction branch migration protein RuvA [Gemmatimonadota bacterium]
MISRVAGRLLVRDLERVEIMTPGGVAYEISIPVTVFEKLPSQGSEVELRTFQVFREDGVFLFGFIEETDRMVFARLLTASGVGPRLAISMLSTFPAPRLIRAIRERDIPALTSISGVGKKTAERLALDLGNRLDDIPVVVDARPTGDGAEEALRALAVLGYAPADAERAVRAVLGRGEGSRVAGDLVKAALAELR